MEITDYLYYTDCFGDTQEYECYSSDHVNKLSLHLFSAGVPEVYSFAFAHASRKWVWFRGTPLRQLEDTFVTWGTEDLNVPKEFKALQMLKG